VDLAFWAEQFHAPLRAILVLPIDIWSRRLGQAIQNINVLLGVPETTGSDIAACFPDMGTVLINPPAPPPGLRGCARGFQATAEAAPP
jgi:hypothetical protein